MTNPLTYSLIKTLSSWKLFKQFKVQLVNEAIPSLSLLLPKMACDTRAGFTAFMTMSKRVTGTHGILGWALPQRACLVFGHAGSKWPSFSFVTNGISSYWPWPHCGFSSSGPLFLSTSPEPQASGAPAVHTFPAVQHFLTRVHGNRWLLAFHAQAVGPNLTDSTPNQCSIVILDHSGFLERTATSPPCSQVPCNLCWMFYSAHPYHLMSYSKKKRVRSHILTSLLSPYLCIYLSSLFSTLLESVSGFLLFVPYVSSFHPSQLNLHSGRESSSLSCRRHSHLGQLICSAEVQGLPRTKTPKFIVLSMSSH